MSRPNIPLNLSYTLLYMSEIFRISKKGFSFSKKKIKLIYLLELRRGKRESKLRKEQPLRGIDCLGLY
ncbi:hypothetical protein DRN43_05970 [Thermococci archaeon]|nr:MAG: hypothetical protein DRN43_05970 [Thermococci archaeon]